MTDTFLIKYGEIGIKGGNRHVFEDALVKRIRIALAPLSGEYEVKKTRGRIYVFAKGDWGYEETVDALRHVFGIVAICPVKVVTEVSYKSLEAAMLEYVAEEYPDSETTFKVKARRIDKTFPLDSMQVDSEIGHAILEHFPKMKVDVHSPEILFDIEIREEIYIYAKSVKGPGGLPTGTAGRAMLLLSGGIDSPVAGYMIAKRGVTLDACYFHAPPYTSERAKQKVVDLCSQVAKYAGPIRLHIVNFTDIQLYIYDQCPHAELTIIMRRYMMKIAEHFARESKDLALITGESVGQVASQTMQSLAATDAVVEMPVFRPLIGFDKNDIVTIAKEIGTYETSILPYEDCCTIFVAKHPVTKPDISVIERSETKLKERIGELYDEAVSTAEVITVR